MSATALHLLEAFGVLLLLLSGITVVLLRAQKEQKRFAVRVALVASAHIMASSKSSAGARRTSLMEQAAPVLDWLARLFGFDMTRLDEYPVRWWMVLPICLVLARVIAEVVGSLLGSVVMFGVPVVWVMLCRAVFKWCHARRSGKLYSQFPDALSMIVRGVRVGIPVTEAIRTVSREAMEPTATEFQKLTDQISIGVALADALREMSERNSLPEYRFFATALALQSQTGGGLSETLENLADVIRKRVALRSRAFALASEARTSIFILASLPVFAGLALAFLNPDYIATLFNTVPGKKVFAGALGSLTTGIVVMQGIVRKSLS